MDQREREGYTPPTRGERFRETLGVWAIYAGGALLVIGIVWVAYQMSTGGPSWYRVFKLFN